MWMRGSERRFLQELDGTTGVPQVWSKPPHFCGWVWPQDDIYGCLVPLGSPKSVGQSSCSLSSLSSNCREYMSFFVKCPMARDCHASFAYRLNHGAVSHALSTYWEVSCEKSQPNQPQDMLCRTRGEALLNALHVAGGSRDSPKWVQVAMLRNRFSLSVGRSELLFYNKLWKITMLSMGKSTINHHFQ
jgi:hypothetical protein